MGSYASFSGRGPAVERLGPLSAYCISATSCSQCSLSTICHDRHCDDGLPCLSGTSQGVDMHTSSFRRCRHFSGSSSCQGGHLQGRRHRGRFAALPAPCMTVMIAAIHGHHLRHLQCLIKHHNVTIQHKPCWQPLVAKGQRTCASKPTQLMTQSELLQQPQAVLDHTCSNCAHHS